MPKFTVYELKRQDEIKQSICDLVVEYFAAWGKPLPISYLSRRFNKQCVYYGLTFQAVMSELHATSRLKITLTEKASRVVTPPIGAWASNVSELTRK